MKKLVAVIITMIVMSCMSTSAYALDIHKIIPKDNVWAKSVEGLKINKDCTQLTIKKNQALKMEDIDVNGHVMDGYYVFGADMGKFKGLSEVTFVLSGTNHSGEELNKAYDDLVVNMEKTLGEPDSSSKASSSWQREKYTVDIKKGDFKAYIGSERKTVGVMITGINMPTPVPEYEDDEDDEFVLTEAEDGPIAKSIYEYAFKRGNKEYQMYYVFDTDDKIVRNFSTNDYGVMVGTFTGDADSGFSIHWMDGWDETFKILGNTKAVLIDNDGFEWEYQTTSIDEAESILRKSGYHDMELE